MEIANLKVYNDNMQKSLLDKAYFLSFVDSDTFIDFERKLFSNNYRRVFIKSS